MPPGEKKSCSEGSGWAEMEAVDKGETGETLSLEQFRNYRVLAESARCGFPGEKTTTRLVASSIPIAKLLYGGLGDV